ncbi:MAG: ROK family protein [Anaerolineales bacterium]|nr:ROK family protein [Anaerolineales bacterium]NTW12567.1 ROK family protein [Anaerolineales bacterium]
MSLIIAIDIGGTHIRVAAYEPNSTKPVAHKRTKSLAHTPGVFDRLASAVESIWKQGEVTAIGIASPGPLDPHTGTILDTPNIPQWTNFPVAPKLSERFGVPVYLDNDANMAGLAEWQFGAGKGHTDLVYLTISTGIGGGVISHNNLLQGYRGMGAELGHMTIDPDGPLCGCGHPGHVESFSSGPAIARYVNERLKAGDKSSLQADPNLSAAQIADAARQGDPLAISAFARAGHYLGIAVANYLAIFDPSILIFGGGVSQVGDLLFKPFEESLRKQVFHPHYLDNLTITRAALGDDAGLLGALALARMKSK